MVLYGKKSGGTPLVPFFYFATIHSFLYNCTCLLTLHSHTGLSTRMGNNKQMSAMMHPRLITLALAQTVAKYGGLIGVWPHLSDSPKEYAKHPCHD